MPFRISSGVSISIRTGRLGMSGTCPEAFVPPMFQPARRPFGRVVTSAVSMSYQSARQCWQRAGARADAQTWIGHPIKRARKPPSSTDIPMALARPRPEVGKFHQRSDFAVCKVRGSCRKLWRMACCQRAIPLTGQPFARDSLVCLDVLLVPEQARVLHGLARARLIVHGLSASVVVERRVSETGRLGGRRAVAEAIL